MTKIEKFNKEIKKFDDIQAREDLRKWLVKYTGCAIQEGEGGKKYPCGTCVIALLEGMGLNSKKKEYKIHNKEIDRKNEVWRAILQIRDAKLE